MEGIVRIMGIILFGYGMFSISSRLELEHDLERVEQLRSEVRRANLSGWGGKELAPKVAEWNKAIATRKSLNARWWSDLIYPDEWDGVEPIPTPLNR